MSHARPVLPARFAIDRVAGAGGMGVVYRALDRTTGGPVAVKVLHAHGGAEAAARFEREATMLADIDHPNVVSYVAHGRAAGGEPWLALEWLDGHDLAAELGRGALSIDAAHAVAAGVAAGLGALHARLLVHRDVKPSNIFLVGGDPCCSKLLDLGIARDAGATRATRSGMVLGSPGYMAPEQVRGERGVGPRADLFALGCVLFECLAGRPVFGGEHALAIMAKVLLEPPPRLAAVRPEAGLLLDDLCARLLDKEPERRPADAAAVLHVLDQRSSTSLGAPPASALSVIEQRLVTVVLASFDAEHELTSAARAGDAATLPADATVIAAPSPSTVLALGARHDVRVECFADGRVVGLVSAGSAAADDAGRVARFALALRRLDARARAAIATGRAVVDGVLPVGEALDGAARLLAAAAPTTLALSPRLDETTANLLASSFIVSTGVSGCVLEGVRDAGEPARLLLGRPTRFVGRAREIGNLASLFEECVADASPRAVLVLAPPGVGKSRLRHELMLRLSSRTDGPEVWLARGDPVAAGSPFGMLRSALLRALGLGAEPSRAHFRESAHRLLRTNDEADPSRTVTFLAELAGLGAESEVDVEVRAARADPILLGDRMAAAFVQLVGAVASERPLVLVLEDLHWGDAPTVGFVSRALRDLRDRPFFVLALARPEVLDVFPRVQREWRAEIVSLRELPTRASAELVRGSLGSGAEASAVDGIVERAAGNAFFLEELVRSYVENGTTAAPDTVLAMVQKRLEAMEDGARLVLRAASVFGETFSAPAVEALVGERSNEVAAWLVELERREVVTRGVDGSTFRHALVRDAAYSMLTEADRMLGHRLAAAFLDRAGGASPRALAEHYERGGEPERAAERYALAAERALEGNAFEEALGRLADGVRCGAQGPVLGALLAASTEARIALGDNVGAEADATRAAALLPRGSAEAFVVLGKLATTRGRLADAAGLAEVAELLRLGCLPAVRGAHAIAASRAAVQMYFLDLRAGSDELTRHAVEAAAELDDPLVQAWAGRAQFIHALVSGEPYRMYLHGKAAAEAFLRAGDARGANGQHVNLGFALNLNGDAVGAERTLRAALAEARRLRMAENVMSALSNLGNVCISLGRFEEAIELERESVRMAEEQRDPRRTGGSRSYLADALWRSGDVAAGIREAERSVEELAIAPPMRAHALSILAAARLAGGDAQGAVDAARAGLELAATVERIEQGDVRLRIALAEGLVALGHGEEAAPWAAEAREIVRRRAAHIPDPELLRLFLAIEENEKALRTESGEKPFP